MIRRSSYLNHVHVGDGTTLLFSGISLCVDLVPRDYWDSMRKDDFSFLTREEKEHLLNRGHLTNLTRAKELEAFKRQARYIYAKNTEITKKQRRASLCFILTYRCNLACAYCYQKTAYCKSPGPPLSEKQVEEILTKYLPEMFPGVPKKNLSFLLFGGEPLLPANRKSIVRILRYARQHSVNVIASTNAIHVPEMIEFFGREYGKIQEVQVTLDGDRAFHDTQRIPVSGEPTFDRIISAIRMLKKTKASVLLRIHTHPHRMKSTQRLAEFLQQQKIVGDNVKMYFSPLNDFQKCNREDMHAFKRIFERISQRTHIPPSSNLTFLKRLLEMQESKIFLKTRYCTVGSNSFRIIDPRGDIYDCYEEVGDRRRRIAAIADGKLKYTPLRKTYARRTLLNMPICLKCSFALFCGGGCAIRARKQTGSIFHPYCHQNKEYIRDTLKMYYLLGRTANLDFVKKT